MNKTLVIMAAGMGSRYGGLKQLDMVGPSGETIIDYSVYDALQSGFNKVVFIIRKEIKDEFIEKIGSRFNDLIAVDYVIQDLNTLPRGYSVPEGRTKPWGTGHAMLSAAPKVRENFLIINADDFYGRDAFQKAADSLEGTPVNGLKAGLIGFRLGNTLSENGSVSRGICQADERGRLTAVEEVHEIRKSGNGSYSSLNREDLKDSDLVSMNMWTFTPEVFSYCEEYFKRFLTRHGTEEKSEFYIPQVVNTLISERGLPVQIHETDSSWFGVTYKEDKDSVKQAISSMTDKAVYPLSLWGNKK